MILPVPPASLNQNADHHCFGCGERNPHGLRLKFFPHDGPDGGVYADWTPSPTEEGYVGMVHGGLISTVCDEVMAWSCYAERVWGMTARLSVRFRRPVRVGEDYRATGWIVSTRSRLIELAAAMHHRETGELVADATARFVRVSEGQSAEWEARYGGLDRS